MKRINYLLFSLLAFFTLTAGVMYHSGTPGGKTGSPADGSSCTQCHTGTPVTQTGWISSDIPVDGYVPGETYTVALIGSHPGAAKYGFEMTSEDGSNSKMGVFTVTNSTTTQLFNDNSITHTAGGNAPVNDGFDYSFSWTAPTIGTGEVTFYAAVNAANGNGSSQGDVIYLTSQAVSEEIITGIGDVVAHDFSIYPNPATDVLNISFPDGDIGLMSIFNVTGKLMRSETVNDGSQFSLTELSKGVYFVMVSSNGNTFKEKLIIK